MLILGITSSFLITLATLIVAAGSIYGIRYLVRLKKRINSSIILIPLYKSKVFLILGAIIIFVLIIITIFSMASSLDAIFLHVNVLVMLLFVLSLFFALISQRFAVIDNGVVAPYRYIDWIEFSDYHIEDNTIFFTGDKHGFSSLSSTTIRLSFNKSDLNKLELILSRNKRTE